LIPVALATGFAVHIRENLNYISGAQDYFLLLETSENPALSAGFFHFRT
jgi:hypothetical protein